MANNSKILTIGGAMQDVFIQQAETHMVYLHRNKKKQSFIALPEGRKIEVEAVEYYTGGGAVNSATSFARLGFNTESFFKIGNDQQGDFILNKLKDNKVTTNHIVQTNESNTGTSFILPCPSGDRAILTYRGANLTLTKNELPQESIAACDYLYVTSLSKEASLVLPIIATLAQKYQKPLATNPGTSQLTANIKTLEEALPNITILTLNCYEATLLMNALLEVPIQKQYQSSTDKKLPLLLRSSMGSATQCFTLHQFFKEILKRGPHIVGVTNGTDGVYITDGSTIYYHPSIATHVVSTLGAGDAFSSAFVAYIAQKKSIEDAIRAGSINSASVLLSLDTQTGLLSMEQIEAQKARMDQSLLQTFPL
ncbi:MAG: carbohydrate kinase family protein [bacterium]|nr:carbohydrate kinase family protein [bacterium]